jgi:hypothetical protein
MTVFIQNVCLRNIHAYKASLILSVKCLFWRNRILGDLLVLVVGHILGGLLVPEVVLEPAGNGVVEPVEQLDEGLVLEAVVRAQQPRALGLDGRVVPALAPPQALGLVRRG